MAMGDWETVTSKKGSKNIKNASKGVKNPNLESMPRIRPNAPFQESKTIYHAFLEEELKKERKLLESEKGVNSKEVKKLTASQPQKKKDRRMTLEESLTSLDHDEIDNVLKKVQTIFPSNPEVWLKDVASLLNSKLDHIVDSDPILADKSHDYPLCVMSDRTREFFLKKLKGFSDKVYDALMDYCLEYVMNGISKDQSSIGYRLTIQLLLKEHSDVVLKNFLKFESLIQKNSSRPLRCLCVLWVVAQVGNSTFSNGIKVWFSLMFSLIEVKSLNSYALGYLENLFDRHPQIKSSNDAMTKTDYFKFFGKLYSDISELPLDIRTRLQRLYPLVKAVAWGDSSKNLNTFFVGYLSRLTNDCNEAKKTELLQCLVTCLENDVKSFTHWKKDYHKYINQSSLLLKFINNNFERLKLNENAFREAVTSFQSTNEKLAEKTNNGVEHGLKSSDILCKNILSCTIRKNSSRMPFFLTITILIALLAIGAAFFHDSFKGSLAHQQFEKVMSNPSVRDFLQKSEAKLRWLIANTAEFASNAYESVNSNPYIKDFLRKSEAQLSWLTANAVELANNAYVSVSSNPHVVEYSAWIRRHSLVILEMLTEKVNEYLPSLLQHAEAISEFSLNVFAEASFKLIDAYNYSYNFVSENVFVGNLSPENIAKEASRLALFVQDVLTNLYSRIQGQ